MRLSFAAQSVLLTSNGEPVIRRSGKEAIVRGSYTPHTISAPVLVPQWFRRFLH